MKANLILIQKLSDLRTLFSSLNSAFDFVGFILNFYIVASASSRHTSLLSSKQQKFHSSLHWAMTVLLKLKMFL